MAMHFLPLAQGRCDAARRSRSASEAAGRERRQPTPLHRPKSEPKQTWRSWSSSTTRLHSGMADGATS
eukprot:5750369-Alexandrium_andersonii.AAC.1